MSNDATPKTPRPLGGLSLSLIAAAASCPLLIGKIN